MFVKKVRITQFDTHWNTVWVFLITLLATNVVLNLITKPSFSTVCITVVAVIAIVVNAKEAANVVLTTEVAANVVQY